MCKLTLSKWIARAFSIKTTSLNKIIGHLERQAATFILWKDRKGTLRSEKIQMLAQNKGFIKHLSSQDAFLLGYLYAQHHEKRLNIPISPEQFYQEWSYQK